MSYNLWIKNIDDIEINQNLYEKILEKTPKRKKISNNTY